MSDRVPDLWDPVWRQEYLARFKQQGMIMGPKNTDELRELLTSRQFPNDPKSQQLQTPSDRMREKALAFGEVLYGLVPDLEFHAFAGNVLHDLVILGEAKLCELREVKASTSPLRVLRAKPEPQVTAQPKADAKK